MYKYIKISKKFYVSDHISYSSLFFLLCFQAKPIMGAKFLNKIAKILLILMKYPISNKVTFLPAYGQIAISVMDYNFKIFDLTKKHVYTVYQGECDHIINKQLENSQHHNMYPGLISYDRKKKTTKEFYYNAYHPTIRIQYGGLPEKLKAMLLKLAQQSNIKTVYTVPYYTKLCLGIVSLVEEKELKNKITIMQKNEVLHFTLKIYRQLAAHTAIQSIPLTLTHGDIKDQNMIVNKGYYRLIDWEYCDYRSPSFDTLFYVFNFTNRKFLAHFIVNDSLRKIFSDTDTQGELFCYFNQDQSVIMNIFYLEYILLRLKQSETREFAKNINLYVIHFIRSINKLRL